MHCHTSSLHTDAIVIHGALELSKNSWLLAIEASEHNRPSLHNLKGGDSSTLLAKLRKACEQFECRAGKPAKIVLCYEAGYDGFWLARLLERGNLDGQAMWKRIIRAIDDLVAVERPEDAKVH